jgi:hypothetical protein
LEGGGKYFGGARRLVVSLAGKPLKFGISDPAEEKFTISLYQPKTNPELAEPSNGKHPMCISPSRDF